MWGGIDGGVKMEIDDEKLEELKAIKKEYLNLSERYADWKDWFGREFSFVKFDEEEFWDISRDNVLFLGRSNDGGFVRISQEGRVEVSFFNNFDELGKGQKRLEEAFGID